MGSITDNPFFRATFLVMGHLAKIDGRVCKDEVKIAQVVLGQMGLNSTHQSQAIGYFSQGKDANFDMDVELSALKTECHGYQALIHLFTSNLMHAAFSDGELTKMERILLRSISNQVGMAADTFESSVSMYKAEYVYRHWQGQLLGSPPPLAQAYAMLGLTVVATDAELKQKYKRLMSLFHPDKLISSGLPEAMLAMATEKTKEIQAAYEQVRVYRSQGDGDE